MLAVAGGILRAADGGEVTWTDAIPQTPDQQIRSILVAVDDVSQEFAAVFPPQGMVVTVDHAALRCRVACPGYRSMTGRVDDGDVRMLARQPFGTGAVRGEGEVEPDEETVLLCEVEEQVKVVELIRTGRRFHPVPEGEAAHDMQPGGANPGKIFVPHGLLRDRRAVVLDANRKGRVRMLKKVGRRCL